MTWVYLTHFFQVLESTSCLHLEFNWNSLCVFVTNLALICYKWQRCTRHIYICPDNKEASKLNFRRCNHRFPKIRWYLLTWQNQIDDGATSQNPEYSSNTVETSAFLFFCFLFMGLPPLVLYSYCFFLTCERLTARKDCQWCEWNQLSSLKFISSSCLFCLKRWITCNHQEVYRNNVNIKDNYQKKSRNHQQSIIKKKYVFNTHVPKKHPENIWSTTDVSAGQWPGGYQGQKPKDGSAGKSKKMGMTG